MDNTPGFAGPTVDVALLADAVQAVRGKLYVLGGGWDTLWVRSFPARHPSLAIGLRIRVPSSWGEEVLRVAVELQDADGAPVSAAAARSHRAASDLERGTTDYGLIRSFTFNNLLLRWGGLLLLRHLGGRRAPVTPPVRGPGPPPGSRDPLPRASSCLHSANGFVA